MQAISLIWGVVSSFVMIIAFIPCLGWLNWVTIPFAAAGVIFGIVALTTAPPSQRKAASILGIVLCALGVLFGFLRLAVGGGVL